MALGALPPAPETWGRWPHHQQPGAEFNMMDAGMMHYDCRTASAPITRPDLTQHFVPGPFSQAPMPSPVSPVSPQYHAPASYGGYNPYSPPQMLDAPYKPHDLERFQPRVLPVEQSVDGGFQGRMEELPVVKRSCSPSIKSEARSTVSDSPSPKPAAQSAPTQGVSVHQFNTPVDNLVRAIVAKSEIFSSEQAESGQTDEKKEGKEAQRSRTKTKRRRFCCDIPGCSKMFAQKNNLDTHRRSHTGESPYVCPYCHRRFTQSVNLKSHINRHTGARPYKCPQCPKRFPQPSNVKAHMKTHIRRELRAHWVCRFGSCKKAFTAKGNLKNHQNTYHVGEIEAFNAKIAAIEDKEMISEEDQEMAKYLREVHNLANKGIKGRGKGRKVNRVVMLHPPHQQPSPAPSPLNATPLHATPYQMPLLPHGMPHVNVPPQHQHQHQHQHQQQQQAAAHHGLPLYGVSNPAAYSMSRPPNMMFGGGPGGLTINTRDAYAHIGYGMMDSDQLSDASSVHGSTPVMHVYEEEHGREFSFAERMY